MGGDTLYCKVDERPIESVPVPRYSAEEHGTWKLLLEKQLQLAPTRACDEFLRGLHALQFPRDKIPQLKDISARIEAKTGWKLLRVEGLVHPTDFFGLLSRKIFPATDFIRQRSELDYTPAPDMFHDLFGHAPLLTNHDFTEFFETVGKVGAQAAKTFPPGHAVHEELNRIYWFTVEFGLVNTPAGLRAYGSGSTSSPQELQFCLGEKCRRHPFDIQVVSERSFDIWHIQEDVFVIDSFQKLGRDFRAWAAKRGLWDEVRARAG